MTEFKQLDLLGQENQSFNSVISMAARPSNRKKTRGIEYLQKEISCTEFVIAACWYFRQ